MSRDNPVELEKRPRDFQDIHLKWPDQLSPVQNNEKRIPASLNESLNCRRTLIGWRIAFNWTLQLFWWQFSQSSLRSGNGNDNNIRKWYCYIWLAFIVIIHHSTELGETFLIYRITAILLIRNSTIKEFRLKWQW